MTEPKLTEREARGSKWLLRTIGLSIVAAVAIVALLIVAVTALQRPATRSVAAQSRAIDTAPATPSAASLSADPAASIKMAAPIPTLPPTAQPEAPAPEATVQSSDTDLAVSKAEAHRVLLPIVSTASGSAAAASKTVTRASTAPSAKTDANAPTAVARTAKPQTSTRQSVKPTAASGEPLSFFFYVKPYCHKSGTNTMVVDVFVTGHGGRAPYTYYHDAAVFAGPQDGMARLTLKAASGNPVPLKIIVVDSTGQRYMEEFFYKTKLRCK